MVLVPAIVVAAVLSAVGAALGVACLLGLLTAFIGMGIYPRCSGGSDGFRATGPRENPHE